MSYAKELDHLSQNDKITILNEIVFMLSQKGFVDGIALYERMVSVLNYDGEPLLKEERKAQMLNGRKRR